MGIEKDPNLYLKVNLLLINHTNDSVKYLGTECLFTKLYHADNKNMVMVDWDCKKNNSILLNIPPHKAARTQLTFKFVKMPDTTFKFKIGMSLIKWTRGKRYDLNHKPSDPSNIIWSEIEEFRTNRRHEMIGLSAQEQIKKQNALILKKPRPIYYLLTDSDRRMYVLSIDQKKIKISDISNGAPGRRKNDIYASVPLKLTNKSAAALKYINMSCSWDEMYKIDNKEASIQSWACESNFPEVIELLPHDASVINIPIRFNKGPGKKLKFRIGLSMQKYINQQQIVDFRPETYMARPETSNMIWSNEVVIY